jgi:recombination protein RecT
MGSKDLVVQVNNVRNLLDARQGALSEALGKVIPVDYFIRVAMITVQRNPKLLECDRGSLIASLLECAILRLVPDSILGHAYLVPYRVRGVLRVQLIPGYRGLIELARRSEKVVDIYARLVYESEPFNLEYGTNQELRHTPLPPGKRGEAIIGAYAIAELVGGIKKFEFMWIEEVDKIKKNSASIKAPESPWNKHEPEMIKKTVIRRLAKTLPQCPRLQKVAAVDTLGDLGISQREVFGGDGDIIEVESEAVADKTARKANGLGEKLKKAKSSFTPPPKQPATQEDADSQQRETLLASIGEGREILLSEAPTGSDTVSVEADSKSINLETAELGQLEALSKRISAAVDKLQK